jgi:glycine cleavage system aminomethyltransferase T
VRFLLDGRPLEFVEGDSVALAVVRAGEHPNQGGCLCFGGDCGSCVAEVDGVAYVRTCQVPARAGMDVRRHPEIGAPQLHGSVGVDAPSGSAVVDAVYKSAHVVIVGRSSAGMIAADSEVGKDRTVLVLDAAEGNEVVGVYAGGQVVVRTPSGMQYIHAQKVIIATGAAELQPVCEGSNLRGIYTTKAWELLRRADVNTGNAVAVGEAARIVPDLVSDVDGLARCTWVSGDLVRFEGENGQVCGVVVRDMVGELSTHECSSVVVGLGSSPRDVLARMRTDDHVTVVGPASLPHELPACPGSGVVCPCNKITVEDLEVVWDRGFRELELVKRSSLCGTGTCQGSACLPYVRAFIAKKSGITPVPFTARPASRQLTMGEASAGFYPEPWRQTALHDEHIKLGAKMDRFGGWWRPWNYGDHVSEYWAVREGVSVGDVSTLGKMIVSGPDSVELLERMYPTTVADIKPGRSRYVLLLNERGHLFDDGMICRETETRFVLTFTSGGAGFAEMWMRDWIETWNLNVRVLDRTASLAAINVTGPLAGQLLQQLGVAEPPKFLQHKHARVAGVDCHVMRLSFTGEASFELHHPVNRSVELWQALLREGRTLGIKPHGLQALFGLRLEKGHVIVGMDTELDTTPRRIAHDWAVKMSKPDFLGREALERTLKLPDARRLVGLSMAAPAPVEGSPIWRNGEILGHVTTSFASPLLGHAVMLGWLKRGWEGDNPTLTSVEIDGRVAVITETPFYDPTGQRARL